MKKTIQDIIDELNINFICKNVDENPYLISEMPDGSLHYECKIKSQYGEVNCFFSKGPLENKEPELYDVLKCIIDESLFINEFGFDGFCNIACLYDEEDNEKLYELYNVGLSRIPPLLDLLNLCNEDELRKLSTNSNNMRINNERDTG